jgi:CheY-like chemotaxis protein
MAKILVVEDDRDIRDLIRMVLEMEGHELHEAATGEDGLAEAKRLRPDAILMDLSLAGLIDGLESTRRLRADSAFDHTPIIALTAHAMRGDREHSLHAGCDEHWTKPIIDLDQFKEMIERVVADGRGGGKRDGGSGGDGDEGQNPSAGANEV